MFTRFFPTSRRSSPGVWCAVVSLLLPKPAHPSPRRDACSSDDGVTVHAVLIFASDPLAAALLAAAVELSGYAPQFGRPGETARGALLRLRPALILADCDHEESCSDEFVGPALMTGARVLLFRSKRTRRDTTELAKRLGVRVVELPADHDTLARAMRHELERDSGQGDRSSAGPR